MKTIQEYFQLLAQLDAEIERLCRGYGRQLKCRETCSSCCTELTLLPIEAESVRRACSVLPIEHRKVIRRQAGSTGTSCPFLSRRRCLIYPARPIICRTHGLPVAYVDPEREIVEVSACPLNFPPKHEFDQEGLLFLDPFNDQLMRLNVLLGQDPPPGPTRRILMRELF